MIYKLYYTDEEGNKYYILDNDNTCIINEDNAEFKTWIAEGNTPEEAD